MCVCAYEITLFCRWAVLSGRHGPLPGAGNVDARARVHSACRSPGTRGNGGAGAPVTLIGARLVGKVRRRRFRNIVPCV